MPLTTQVKFLRALETKEFMRLGGETVTKVDVRIIAATNKDLQIEVDQKKFRNDLYFRLKAVTLNIPPLRNRRGDILELAEHFLRNYTSNNKTIEYKLTKDAVDLLTSYDWPGNIRELKNAVESAAALSKNEILSADSFFALLSSNKNERDYNYLPIHLNRPPETLDREMIYRALIEIKKDLIELKHMAVKNNGDEHLQTLDIPVDEIIPLDELEKRAIINALVYSKYNKRKTAGLLKISEKTLYRKLKDYGIQ
jgi:DNA-binding NtrC family response regulator